MYTGNREVSCVGNRNTYQLSLSQSSLKWMQMSHRPHGNPLIVSYKEPI